MCLLGPISGLRLLGLIRSSFRAGDFDILPSLKKAAHRKNGRTSEATTRVNFLFLSLTTDGGHDIAGGPDRVPDPRRHWRRRHR